MQEPWTSAGVEDRTARFEILRLFFWNNQILRLSPFRIFARRVFATSSTATKSLGEALMGSSHRRRPPLPEGAGSCGVADVIFKLMLYP
jgi:hypothetical protein